jgi:sulfoxide reductase catalytic subunit YedY
MVKIKPSEITSEHIYMNRRKFMVGIGALATSAAVLSACGPELSSPAGAGDNGEAAAEGLTVSKNMDELGDSLTTYAAITNFNNYYEFTTTKESVARLAAGFVSSPWAVEVGGLVNNPKTYDLDDLMKFTQEERIYRLRCVEGWSMVIPWNGFPLSKILEEVEPTSEAKFVRFETLLDPEQMPGQQSGWFPWPYVEGLRVDEAMNDLTILATGLYGKALPPQDGAPVRLVVPWKYGFKSIKAIVKIDLVDTMPNSLWMASAPSEYGFYANVNPDVPHPRWSQSSERRIGELGRRETLPFNGYGQEVAHLYDGLDLRVWY